MHIRDYTTNYQIKERKLNDFIAVFEEKLVTALENRTKHSKSQQTTEKKVKHLLYFDRNCLHFSAQAGFF